MGAAVLDEVDELFGSTQQRTQARQEQVRPGMQNQPTQARPVSARTAGQGGPVGAAQAGAPWEEVKPAGVVQPMRRPETASSHVAKDAVERAMPTSQAKGQPAARPDRTVEPAGGEGRQTTVRREVDAAQAASDERGDAGRQPRDFFSVHCYGGKAALCFSADTTKSEDAPTVRIEAAPATGPRAYNWGQKIAVQCTVKELPIVLATIMGWMPSVRFAAHGADNKKGFSFEHQNGGKLFAKVWDARGARMVPIAAADLFGIADLFVRQMLKGKPHMSHEGLLVMVRQLAQCYAEAGLGEQERSPGG